MDSELDGTTGWDFRVVPLGTGEVRSVPMWERERTRIRWPDSISHLSSPPTIASTLPPRHRTAVPLTLVIGGDHMTKFRQ